LAVAGTVAGAAEERVALAVVSGEAGSARELVVGLSVASDAMEQVAAYRGQQVVRP
jgi:hypothetical protein